MLSRVGQGGLLDMSQYKHLLELTLYFASMVPVGQLLLAELVQAYLPEAVTQGGVAAITNDALPTQLNLLICNHPEELPVLRTGAYPAPLCRAGFCKSLLVFPCCLYEVATYYLTLLEKHPGARSPTLSRQ